MTPAGIKHPFSMLPGSLSLRPMLPITIGIEKSVVTSALLDTGSDVNVLPYSLGLSIGADWQTAPFFPPISGNLAQVETRCVAIDCSVFAFPKVTLLFVWPKTDSVRFILGQYNFFDLYHACFFRSRREFELRPKN